MQDIVTLQQAWIFDSRGSLIQTKQQSGKKKASQIYSIAREALRYVGNIINDQQFRRVSFVNGKEQWLITATDKQILVLHKIQEKQ